MNKAQEKIMKGMAKQLAQFDGQDWGALFLEAQGTYKGRALVLGCHLHSQGVVIKHGEGEANLWVEPLIELKTEEEIEEEAKALGIEALRQCQL